MKDEKRAFPPSSIILHPYKVERLQATWRILKQPTNDRQTK